ncbi:Oligopeptide transporter, periplasmic-binding protein [Bacillus thuringiensis serovar huazhongensis BGSC 4BD1]|nr:Oligopeptide transporter, periplasmic-binding protein [Bacillus thuringiensis serovar huazhongensis BGSC 4BD1]
MGRSYLQRSSVKGSIANDFGEEFNYTWNEIKKLVKRVVLNGVTLLLYNF